MIPCPHMEQEEYSLTVQFKGLAWQELPLIYKLRKGRDFICTLYWCRVSIQLELNMEYEKMNDKHS